MNRKLTHSNSFFLRYKLLQFCIFFILTTSPYLSFSQCQVSIGGNISATCSSSNVQLGAGECRTLLVPTNGWHTFSFSDNAQSNGYCVNGTAYTSSETLFLSGNATICIRRQNSNWIASSAILTYSRTTPTNVQASSNPSNICLGATVDLNGSGNFVTNWSWSGNGVNNTSIQNTTATPTTSGNLTYQLTASNINCSVNASTQVNVADNLTVTISGSNEVVCLGQTLIYNASGSGGVGTGTYQ